MIGQTRSRIRAAARGVFTALLVILTLTILPTPSFGYRGYNGVGRGGWGSRPAYRVVRAGQARREARQQARRQRMESRPQNRGPQQPYQNRPGNGMEGRGNGARPPYRGENQTQTHLPEWLRAHQGMSLAQQQHALSQEPGFNRLPPRSQKQVMNSLARIDSMPPRQRQRTLDTIEALEHLNPQRRQAVMASEQAIRNLPPERRRAVKQAFLNLRNYPPAQRQDMLTSPQLQSQFTPQERTMLGNILTVEPYEPPQR